MMKETYEKYKKLNKEVENIKKIFILLWQKISL